MTQLAANVVMNEIDAERALLGSLFQRPQTFGQAGEIDPAWFSDGLARYMFEECSKLVAEGHTLSPNVIISLLPEDLPSGATRANFYASVRMSGVPENQMGGLVATLKDRWARRQLLAAADGIRFTAPLIGHDPFIIAQEAVGALDTLNAVRGDKVDGSLHEAAQSLIQSLERPEGLQGATTGLRSVDRKLNGYRSGQLYVIAGRPGMGKSAFMVSSMRKTAKAGFGVGLFSLEMTAEEIAARAISDSFGRAAAPTYGSILKGMVSEAERDEIAAASEELMDLPMHIDASPRLTFSEIAARARRLKDKLEGEGRFLAVLCIDHMGLVTPSDRYRGNKVAEAGEVSGAARALAKELDCCVVLLCQLSREVEKRDDKRPVMADLRWSGEIEQDAHVVAFLYREAYYLQNDPKADPLMLQDARFKLDLLVRKNRNGEVGDIPLWCSIAHSRVEDER